MGCAEWVSLEWEGQEDEEGEEVDHLEEVMKNVTLDPEDRHRQLSKRKKDTVIFKFC